MSKEIIIQKKELKRIAGHTTVKITAGTEDRFVIIDNKTKPILEGYENKLKNSEDPARSVKKSLSLIIKMYGYKYDAELIDLVAFEIVGMYGFLGEKEIYRAFKLAFNDELNLDRKNIEAYGEPLNLKIMLLVLSAYKSYRNKIIKQSLIPKELDGSRQKFLEGKRIGASKEIAASIDKMYNENKKK